MNINKITKRYIDNLPPLLHDYLMSRGLSSETIKEYGFGFAKSKKEEIEYFKEDLEGFRVNGNISFNNRIMIPIKGNHGKIVAFTGRTIFDLDDKWLTTEQIKTKKFLEDKKIHLSKYKNSVYDKSLHLYGLSDVNGKKLVVVESPMNAMATEQLGGFGLEAVALCGGSLSPQHVKEIEENREVNYILILLDGDKSGRKSTLNVIRILRENFNGVVQVGLLPLGFDVMDLIKQPNTLENVILDALDPTEFLRLYILSSKSPNAQLRKYEEVKSLARPHEMVTNDFVGNLLTGG